MSVSRNFARVAAAFALAALLGLPASLPLRAADAPGINAMIRTVEDETIAAPIESLSDGKLTLGTSPVRVLPLLDIENIRFGAVLAPTPIKTVARAADLEWLGQDNFDQAQQGTNMGGNGIQDVHLRLHNLKAVAIGQIEVSWNFNTTRWRLSPVGGNAWRLAMTRGATSPDAEIYLEPSNVDMYGQPLSITLTYTDGTVSELGITATTHTNPQLKVGRDNQANANAAAAAAPGAVAATGPPGRFAEIPLMAEGTLKGEIIGLSAETLTLRTSWRDEVQIPLVRTGGVWFLGEAPEGARAEFDKWLAAPREEDLVLLLAPDKSLAMVQANVSGMADGVLKVRYRDGELESQRSLKVERLVGLVFAAHPKVGVPAGPRQTFSLSTGESISGIWNGVDGNKLLLQTAWGAKLAVPSSSIAEIRFRFGRVTSLADLDPAKVEESPFFTRIMSWRRDAGFEGGPPKVKGNSPSRAVAMHSRSKLTYDLDAQYSRLKTTVGFEDSEQKRGRVALRVWVDGRAVFEEADLRADGEPKTLDIPLEGAKTLILEVDFGENDDVGDRVIWAEPRLFRREAG